MDAEVDEQVLLERISSEFSDLKWTNWDLVTEGWDHAVIILDGRWVFRFPLDDEYAGKLAHEIEFLRRLEPLVDVSIPRYSMIAADSSFAGYEIVGGQALEVERFHALSGSNKQAVARQLAAFLTVMHGTDVTDRAVAHLQPFHVPEDQERVRAGLSANVRAHLTDEQYALAVQILDQVDAVLETAPVTTVIHADVYHRHLLWDEAAQQLGIIDFSDMCIGDAALDFAELHEYGKGFVEDVYEYYEGVKDDAFLERTWTYQKWIGVYMMTDHFEYQKTTFAEARKTFDRIIGS